MNKKFEQYNNDNFQTKFSINLFIYYLIMHYFRYSAGIGFGDQFQLDGKSFVAKNNSIVIQHKDNIWIDGSHINFGNGNEFFTENDFVGLGIIYQSNSKMEYFATCNGKLIGKILWKNIKKFNNEKMIF